MAAYLKLSNDHVFAASSAAMDDMLFGIGEATSGTETELAIWLKDVAGRPAPFLDFDIRRLSASHQAAFWAAAERLSAQRQDDSEAAVHKLLKLKASMPPGTPESLVLSDKIDLTELWDARGRRIFQLPSRQDIKDQMLALSVDQVSRTGAAVWARERLPPEVDTDAVDLRLNDEFAIRHLRLLAAADSALGSSIDAAQWRAWASEVSPD
ncbi:MAG: hypothetical protein ACK4UQ_09665 [Brevundimonas sp.]